MSPDGIINLIGLIAIPLSLFAIGMVQAGKARTDQGVASRTDANAKEHAELHSRITMLAAQLAEYRERVAREYAGRDMMDQMENRLGVRLNRMDEKLDRLMETR